MQRHALFTLRHVVIVEAEVFLPQVVLDARGDMLESDRYLSPLPK